MDNKELIIDYIKNGVVTKDGIRPFDILDYYKLSEGLSPKEFLANLDNNSERTIFRIFFNNNNPGEELRPFEINGHMKTKHEVNLKRDENGMPIPGTGDLVEPEFKQYVLSYLRERNIPITGKIFSIAINRYMDNELEPELGKNKTK